MASVAARARPESRCLRRGLAVLGELNRRHIAGAAEIGAAIDVPRPTVHRLLLALAEDGYARQVGTTEFFAPDRRVAELSAGWDGAARALDIATRLVDDLAARTLWPIDVTVFDVDAMVVRHSSYDRSPWSLLPRSPIGHRIPLCGTAPGRMFLAGLDAADRTPFLASAAGERHAVEMAAERGFAFRDGGVVPRTTSVAVPVGHGGATLLCVSMAFIRSSTVLGEAIAEYVPMLKTLASTVEAAMA